jgi:hypothetical protein
MLLLGGTVVALLAVNLRRVAAQGEPIKFAAHFIAFYYEYFPTLREQITEILAVRLRAALGTNAALGRATSKHLLG